MESPTVPWRGFAQAEPELAAAVAARFTANRHHVLGTLRADGHPRLSGLEAPIRDGHLWLGMMPASVKCADLTRDARFAIHSAPLDAELVDGDAKIDASAIQVTEDDPEWQLFLDGMDMDMDLDQAPGGGMALFVADIQRVTLTLVADETLHIQTWTPAAGLVTHQVR